MGLMPLELEGVKRMPPNATAVGSSAGAGYFIEDQLDPADIAYLDKPGDVARAAFDAVSQQVPELKVGTKLEKVLRLKANRWINIGKGPKVELRIEADGVSREHCTLRWDPQKRQVEFRDMSARGTYVNGQQIRNAKRNLAHADRITIEGKGKKYTFVLDLRPVGLGFGDPCTKKELAGNKAASLVRRREQLRQQLLKVEEQIKSVGASAFEKESAYYKIVAKTSTRKADMEASDKQAEIHKAERARFDVELGTSRIEWKERLRKQRADNEAKAQPLHDLTAEVQLKLERMKLMKAEWERKVEPQKFDFIEAGDFGAPPAQIIGAEEDDDEEEAVLDLLKPQTPRPVIDEEDLPGLKLELFGDYETTDEEATTDIDGDDEPLAKRSKTT